MPSKVTIEPMPGTAPKQLTFEDLKYGEYFRFVNYPNPNLFRKGFDRSYSPVNESGLFYPCTGSDVPVTRVDVHIQWKESEDQS